MQLDQARGHHRQIGHHVGVAEESAEGAHGVGDAPAALHDLFIRGLGVEVPLPRVLEGHDLRGGFGFVVLFEEHVVVLAAVEGRIEIDEVNRLVLDVLAQDGQVVAVIEAVLIHGNSDFSVEGW